MIRAFFALLFAVLFLILSMPVLGVLLLVTRNNPEKRDRVCQAIVQWAFRVILAISGTRITVKGLDHIPADQAVLFAGNHRSIFDIIATFPYMKRPGGYIAKDSMKKVPLLNLWMKHIYCFFLDRSDLKAGMQVILDSIKQIKDGKNVFVFAEGTRSRQKEDLPLLPFHEGSFRIATKTGCPIIPVAINNSAQIFEAHLPRVKATHIVIEFGAPIDPTTLSKDEKKHVGAMVQQVITDMVAANQSAASA